MRLKLPGNRTLVWILIGLVAAWLLMRALKNNNAQKGINRGQAGSIFQPPGVSVGGGQ